MYAIRVRLEWRGGPPSADPVAPALLAGLGRSLQPQARLGHARIRERDEVVEAVVFVVAAGLFAAERRLALAMDQLTAQGAELAGWRVGHCEADSWIALGLHEEHVQP
ncbi:hypothetical protein GCM10010193_51470 [Kitasatospora atroaurantiaca]|uniref:Uncharacterized protein n=1 Tax=Kitasatospora atroaurantiaca TaxID=285545 RepID=A0A561EXY7_9ACTN|nr:hypothetical protein [Kitasatospora atroaurantiaca]TWE20478.1 hypothetical protein FB465_5632 [Kitasatospora atroaurantiaca]